MDRFAASLPTIATTDLRQEITVRQQAQLNPQKEGQTTTVDVDGHTVRLQLRGCDWMTIAVTVNLPPSINLRDKRTVTNILDKAGQWGYQVCTAQKGPGVRVTICDPGVDTCPEAGLQTVIGAQNRHRPPQSSAWEWFKNRPAQEQAQAEARRAREQQAAAQQEAQRRLAEFTQQNRITDWPNGRALKTNPFVYEGKVIGVLASFERMISATSGLFEMPSQHVLEPGTSLVISDIPKGLLTTPGWVKVAATVEGLNADGLVQLKYRDLLVCGDQACQEVRKP